MNNLAMQEAFDAQIAASKKSTESLTKRLKDKEDEEAKQVAADVRTASMVLSAMSKIRVPEDGKDGKDGADAVVDYTQLEGYISKSVDALPKAADGKDAYIPKKGVDYFDGDKGEDAVVDYKALEEFITKEVEALPKAVNGINGIDGTDGETPVKGVDYVDGVDGKDGYTPEKGTDYFDGKDGYTPVKGKDYFDGKDGKNGADGTSVTSIKTSAFDYIFTLSNGTEFKLPIPTVQSKGGYTLPGKDGKAGSKGSDGKSGLKGREGARGKKGIDGEDGVGIHKIYSEDGFLFIELTSGKVSKTKLPRGSGAGGAPVAPGEFQRAARVPYDNKKSGLGADNVQDAVDEIAAGTVAGNAFPAGTVAGFMATFNSINDTHSARFVYNAGKQLISTSVVDDSDNPLYMIDFTYTTGVLTSKLITDLVVSDSVETVFEYTDELLTRKLLTYNS